jgi:signal peptidase I
MDRFLTFLETKTVKYLTKRKAKQLYIKSKKKTFFTELVDWLDALVFAIFWIILINQYLFQLFVIPSPSMVSTLLVGDRVIVNKDAYGVELYPSGKKVGTAARRVQRDEIITFYNPEYDSKGPLFDILSQVVYMGTISLVNIDKNPDGTPAERLYVKRAVGMPGDVVKFIDGDVEIKVAGTGEFVSENLFREEESLSLGPNRTLSDEAFSHYSGLKANASLKVYDEMGVKQYPQYLISEATKLANSSSNYIFELYQYNHTMAATKANLDPSDMSLRSENAKYESGIYIPQDYVLPLGDNRDNSYDGRFFGPVSESKINGQVVGRFWPLNRISSLIGK